MPASKPEQKKTDVYPAISSFPDFQARLAEACEHLRQNRPVSAYECLRNLQDHIEYILKK